jgi:hypothetical protein
MHKLFAFVPPLILILTSGNEVTLPDHVALANELLVKHPQAQARNLLEHGSVRSIGLKEQNTK